MNLLARNIIHVYKHFFFIFWIWDLLLMSVWGQYTLSSKCTNTMCVDYFFSNFFNNHCNYVYHYYIIDKDVLYKHVCIVYVLGIQTFTSKQIFFNKKGFRNNECIHCTFVQPFLCSFAFKFLHNLFKITFNKINI